MGTLVAICVACAAYFGWKADPFWTVPVMAWVTMPAAWPSMHLPRTVRNLAMAYFAAFMSLAAVYGVGWGLSRVL
jgi:hypothetical protein